MNRSHFKTQTNRLSLLVLVLVGLVPAIALGQANGQLERHVIRHQKLERSFYLHLPTGFKKREKLPVLFVLHGGGKADGDETARRTGFNQLADKHRFIVVYPNGIDSQWNDGRQASFRKNRNNRNADDVDFLKTLIDKMIDDYHADARRIYFTGGSNGGMMTYRVGCELTDKVAAIAPMICNLPRKLAESNRPRKPLPVLIINGTADPMIPYQGGSVGVFGRQLGKVLSTDESIAYWKKHNRLSSKIKRTKIRDRDPDDDTHVIRYDYGEPDAAAPITLYKIVEGGHTLPGRTRSNRVTQRLLGNVNNDIDSSQIVWEFVSRFSRK